MIYEDMAHVLSNCQADNLIKTLQDAVIERDKIIQERELLIQKLSDELEDAKRVNRYAAEVMRNITGIRD